MPSHLKNHLDEIVYLKSIKSLLSWDQEVLMPHQGVDFRAEQIALIEKILKQKV